jgi:hypothetical protein
MRSPIKTMPMLHLERDPIRHSEVEAVAVVVTAQEEEAEVAADQTMDHTCHQEEAIRNTTEDVDAAEEVEAEADQASVEDAESKENMVRVRHLKAHVSLAEVMDIVQISVPPRREDLRIPIAM